MKARKLISNGVLYNARMFCTRRSFLWEETGAPEENQRVRVGDQHTLSHTTTAHKTTVDHGDGTRTALGRSQCMRYHCATRTPNNSARFIQEENI